MSVSVGMLPVGIAPSYALGAWADLLDVLDVLDGMADVTDTVGWLVAADAENWRSFPADDGDARLAVAAPFGAPLRGLIAGEGVRDAYQAIHAAAVEGSRPTSSHLKLRHGFGPPCFAQLAEMAQ